MAKPNWVGSVGNGNNQGKGNNQGEEKIHPAVARAGLRPWDEDFKKPEEGSDVPENGPKTGNNNFSDLAAFFKEKIMTMAKPIWAGWSGNGKFNSALDRSWLVTVDENGEIAFENQGRVVLGEEDSPQTGSNDFFYIDTSFGTSNGDEEGSESLRPVYGEPQPAIDGGGAADQIIMMEDAEISDAFFTKMSNVTVLKLGDGKGLTKDVGYVAEGSSVILGENAQAAGIREVTGGPGDDVIDFSDYSIGAEEEMSSVALDDEDEAIPLEIIIRGGAGADKMTASAGNDTFIWKACDMEGTNEEHFDLIINFTIGEDVLDISDLLNGFGFDYDEYILKDSEGNPLYDDNGDPLYEGGYLEKWVMFDESNETLFINIVGDAETNEFEALVKLQGVETFDLVNDLMVC